MKSMKGLEQFEPWQLEAFAEDGNIPQVEAFSKQYPDLWASWLEGYRREQKQYEILRRFDCPPPDELRNYYWTMLAPEQHEKIATHLEICFSCQDELRSLEESMAVEEDFNVKPHESSNAISQVRESVEAIAEQIKWTVATLVSPSTSQLVPAALRSDEVTPALDSAHPSTLLFEADDIDLNLIIQKESDRTITLGGQILASSSLVNAYVKIVSADPQFVPIQVQVNDVGEFTIRGLISGTYQLHLTFSKNIIAIPNLVLE